jgi:uncharacterized protein (TIGR02391 family)
MDNQKFSVFEQIARRVHLFSDEEVRLDSVDHLFDVRNIHPNIPHHVRHLFDDGHYAQATFEAFKYLDKQVAKIAASNQSGYKLMIVAFSDQSPKTQLTPLETETERDEQKGFQFLFAGSIMAIRNPRGHEYKILDNIDECLDHLALVSLLLRRLDKAGFRLVT